MTDHEIGKRRFFLHVFFLVSVILIVIEARCMGIDSDRANHLLQVRDIAGGNLFLSGWNLTKAHFLTTDLMAYLIGYLCGGGLGYTAAVITYAFMYTALQAVTMTACLKDRKELPVSLLCYLCIPCWYMMAVGRIHVIAFVYCVIVFILAGSLPEPSGDAKNRECLRKQILLCGILTIGSFGDFLVFAYGAIPVIVYAASQILIYAKKGRFYVGLLLSAILSFPLSVILDLLYYGIGGANKNGSVMTLVFSTHKVWADRIEALCHAMLQFAEADFTGKPVLSAETVLCLCNAFFVVLSLGLTVRLIYRFFRKKETDTISVLFAISALTAGGIYVFTERSEERYLEITAVALLVILVRSISGLPREHSLLRIACTCLLLLSAAGRVNGLVKGVTGEWDRTEQIRTESGLLRDILDESSCKNGYASFWNASVVTAVTHGDITVRHIQRAYENGGQDIGMKMYRWFNKDEWYEEPADFVLINNRSGDRGGFDEFGISEENCISVFGVPARRVEEGGYLVLFYDHDLSQQLTK